MKKLTTMFTKNNTETELQTLITETLKNDKLRVETYKNRSTYVNCNSLKLGSIIRKDGMFSNLKQMDYSPV